MENINEIWKDIKGYEGIYQVSNLGRVRRIKGWEGGSIASKLLNINQGHISQCCRGKLKTAGGYIWRYK